MVRSLLLAAPLAGPSVAPRLGPQEARVIPREAILHHLVGDRAGDWFGYAVADVGDLSGDGVADFAVGAHQNWSSGPTEERVRSGYVRVFSGVDGSPLATFRSRDEVFPNTTDGHFGVALLATPDADGDGARELVVGSYLHDTEDMDCGAVFVFSGLDPRPTRLLRGSHPGDRLGFALATLADLDGDGRGELLLASPKEDRFVYNGGSLRVVSGATFEPLLRVDGHSYDGSLSFSCAVLGDLDGDGVPELAAGAPYSDADEWVPSIGVAEDNPERDHGRDDEGLVVVVSGATGAPLHCWYGERAGGYLGWSIAGLGDVDGDGLDDVAAGAIQSGFVGNFTGPGYVRAWSGGTGRLLWELEGTTIGEQLGWSLADVGDVDGDGCSDLLVGAPDSISFAKTRSVRCGALVLVSGRDGAQLARLRGLAPGDQLGVAAARIADLDGDGVRELLVGAPENVLGQTRPGYALVVSGRYLLELAADAAPR